MRIVFILLSVLFISTNVFSEESTLTNVTNKIIKPTWLQDRSIKWGLLTSTFVAQATTGIVESAKYGGKQVSESSSYYHIYRYGQDLSWISAGWFAYAEKSQIGKPWWAKAARYGQAICWGRNINEMAARWNLTGDCFNYDDISWNRKAMIGIKISLTPFRLAEVNVSGVGTKGKLIDIGFWGVGGVCGWISDKYYK